MEESSGGISLEVEVSWIGMEHAHIHSTLYTALVLRGTVAPHQGWVQENR